MTYASISALLLIQRVHLQKYREENILGEYRDESQKQITAGNIHEWLLSRLPDDNRHNLLSECVRAGIRPIGAEIFRISEGRQLYDDYWFKFVPQDSDTLEQVIAEE